LAGKALPDNIPMRLYESAIKPPAPSAKFSRLDQQAVLQEGLNAGITPSQFGIDKLEGLIDDINSQITNKINTGAKNGRTVNTTDIAQRLDAAEEIFRDLPNPKPYLDAIDEVRQGFLSSKGQTMTIDKAQKMKTSIYRVLRDSYGELSTATKEANKQIARGAKEELQLIFPELKNLNKQESLYLKLEPMIEKAAGRIDKRDLMGIGTPIAGAAVSAVAGPAAGKMAWLLKAVLDNPNMKAHLAILLNKANKGGMGKGYIDQRLATYIASKANETQNVTNLQ
jgi:hypothetical protein